MKIYVACALTHVPREQFQGYVQHIHACASALAAHSAVADVKYALVNSDPQLAEKPFEERARLCYLWDRGMVESANLVIADCTYSSIGLGIELQIAEAKSIPVVITYQENAAHRAPPTDYVTPDRHKHTLQIGEGYVSLMALGLPNLYKIIPYRGSDEAIAALVETIDLLVPGAGR